jgi:hypothetical protein
MVMIVLGLQLLMQSVKLMVFNTNFKNISAISWQSVLFVEEAGVPRENHTLATSH